ncbi:MAG: 3'-5' exonuclease [Clostridia bacterium]|nr:3'-5' exonuclease [Clostridia bacterium]
MILYFDTETSGLYPGQICQLSYIMQEKEGFSAKNFFFTVDNVEMGALLVHGFSVQKLKELSNGKRFGDFFLEIKSDFEKADIIVSHNTAFDFSFMRKEYERLNEVFYIKNEFCSMKRSTPICKLLRKSGVGYKYPKLQELCEFCAISDNDILSFSSTAFDSVCSFHDARFDTSAVYLSVNKMIEKGCFKELEDFL